MIVTVTLNPSLDKTLTLPRFQPGEVNRAQVTRLDVGGKGINVSRALLSLGMPSLAMGLWGGVTGQFLAAGLRDLGIEYDFVQVQGETRTNLTVRDESTGSVTKINEPGPQVMADELAEFHSRVRARVARGQCWALSGSLPAGAPAHTYAELIEIIQVGGARAFLDSSGPALKQGWRAQPYVLKCNVEEAQELLGCALDSEQRLVAAIHALRQSGVQVAVITRGADGAILGAGAELILARPPVVEVKSAVAAGDAALAGLLWALYTGVRDWAAVARWCVALGTAAAMQEGSGVGDRQLVEEILPRIKVEKIEQTKPSIVQGGIR